MTSKMITNNKGNWFEIHWRALRKKSNIRHSKNSKHSSDAQLSQMASFVMTNNTEEAFEDSIRFINQKSNTILLVISILFAILQLSSLS